MIGSDLKEEAALDEALTTPDDREHYNLSVAAAMRVQFGFYCDGAPGPDFVAPPGDSPLLTGDPIAFRSDPEHPNPNRYQSIGRISRHRFYGFIEGRWCQ